MKHMARKRFGQHFLSDGGIVDAIVALIDPRPQDAMLEIGPGLGAITQPLVERLGRLTVVELDRDLAVKLRAHAQLQVVESDVLKVDVSALAARMLSAPQGEGAAGLPQDGIHPGNAQDFAQATSSGKIRIVGNLPYNISTPILFHLLAHVGVVRDQHFMLQKEVVDRMVAQPSTADYSRLSVMLQWRYAMKDVLFVPPQSFEPPPRVNSAVIRMVPLAEPPMIDVKLYGELVQVAFSQRRKILRNTLGKWLDVHNFTGAIDLQRRAEEVPVSEYVALTQAVQT